MTKREQLEDSHGRTVASVSIDNDFSVNLSTSFAFGGVAVLQIIGFLGCFYLIIKAMELFARSVKADELTRGWLHATSALAFFGAMGFALLLAHSGSRLSEGGMSATPISSDHSSHEH